MPKGSKRRRDKRQAGCQPERRPESTGMSPVHEVIEPCGSGPLTMVVLPGAFCNAYDVSV